MPLDVLGCTRATLMRTEGYTLLETIWVNFNAHRAGDRALQFLLFNEEFLVSARH